MSFTNYHLMIDDKFIDDFVKDALSVGPNNIFIVTDDAPGKYVTSKNVIFAKHGSKKITEIATKITSNDRVYIHWFSIHVNQFISTIPETTQVFLMFWGADFLEPNSPSNPDNLLNRFLYEDRTLDFMRKRIKQLSLDFRKNRIEKAKQSGNWKNALHTRVQDLNLRRDYIRGTNFNDEIRERKRFLDRIEAICHWNSFDVQLLERLYDVKLEQRYFVYGVGTDEINEVPQSDNDKLIIWLGNSDTPTNNHLDAIEMLSFLKDENISIICPLNYGDKEYGDLIEKEGVALFGNKFIALRNYIQRDEYYALMDKVHVAIMFHNRGQAGGNLFAFIKKGKRIFMKTESSIYQLFDSLGMHLFQADELRKFSIEELKSPMESSLIENNARILHETVSNEDKRMEALKRLLLS